MEVAPYLNFDGHCAEAFKFYEKTLKGKIVMLSTHGETPMKDQVPPDWQDKVIHARMELGNFVLMGCDAPASHYVKPQGTHVSVSVSSAAEGERIFNALAEGGSVTMPYAKTFWAAGFGMLTDRFGVPWMVNGETA